MMSLQYITESQCRKDEEEDAEDPRSQAVFLPPQASFLVSNLISPPNCVFLTIWFFCLF